MLKIYGSKLCPDCVECCKSFDHADIAYEFFDFSDSLLSLKEFLHLRDSLRLFESVKESGSIGIPCIVDDDGTVCLDWQTYVSQDKT